MQPLVCIQLNLFVINIIIHHTASRGARSSRQDCDLTQLPSELKHTEHRDDKAQTQIYLHHSNGVTPIVVAAR